MKWIGLEPRGSHDTDPFAKQDLPNRTYVIFYIDENNVIAGYKQMGFLTIIASSVDAAIAFVVSMGIKEENIQSIDEK